MSASGYLYLISLVNNVDMFLGIIFLVSFIVSIICIIHILASHDDSDSNEPESTYNKTLRTFKSSVKIAIIAAFISIPIPSTRTMYLMMGANYLDKSEVPAKVEKILNSKLDEYLIDASKTDK